VVAVVRVAANGGLVVAVLLYYIDSLPLVCRPVNAVVGGVVALVQRLPVNLRNFAIAAAPLLYRPIVQLLVRVSVAGLGKVG